MWCLQGPKYWRFQNDVLDPGYPKVIETGFEGLRGHITAALSVPQHQRRSESVYFFKRGEDRWCQVFLSLSNSKDWFLHIFIFFCCFQAVWFRNIRTSLAPLQHAAGNLRSFTLSATGWLAKQVLPQLRISKIQLWKSGSTLCCIKCLFFPHLVLCCVCLLICLNPYKHVCLVTTRVLWKKVSHVLRRLRGREVS